MSNVDITFSPELLPAIPEDVLIIVPVRNMVMFPGVMMPMHVSRERSIAAIEEAVNNKRKVGLVMQRDVEEEKPEADDLYKVGTSATVLRFGSHPEEAVHQVICQGEQRFKIIEFIEGHPFMLARVEFIKE